MTDALLYPPSDQEVRDREHGGTFPWHPDVLAADLPREERTRAANACPACQSRWLTVFRWFDHPIGEAGMWEWTSRRNGGALVPERPRPSFCALARCATPRWPDAETWEEEPDHGEAASEATGNARMGDLEGVGCSALLRRKRETVLASGTRPFRHLGETRLVEVTRSVRERGRVLAAMGDVLLAERSWVPMTGWRTALAWSAAAGRYGESGAVVLSSLGYRVIDGDQPFLNGAGRHSVPVRA